MYFLCYKSFLEYSEEFILRFLKYLLSTYCVSSTVPEIWGISEHQMGPNKIFTLGELTF